VGAGAKPFIAYAILSTTDYGAGDEVIYPNPGFPIYQSQIIANGPKPVPTNLPAGHGFPLHPAPPFDLGNEEKAEGRGEESFTPSRPAISGNGREGVGEARNERRRGECKVT